MKNGIFWLTGPWPGKLAIAARPRGGDWLHDELSAWRQAGVGTVVSLLTSEEEQDLQLEKERVIARDQGMRFLSLPIPDRQVPESEAQVESAIQGLDAALASGGNVLVHCRQGVGRSGLLAACLLIHRGVSPQAAVDELTAVRGVTVPETPQQRQWIDHFAKSETAHLHSEFQPPVTRRRGRTIQS